jgi:protein AroM
VLPEILPLLPKHTQVIERGALDGLGGQELDALTPTARDDVLVTRLKDGTQVEVAGGRVLPLVQAAVDNVCSAGADIVAVLCTGSLPGLRSTGPLLFPGPIVRGLVGAFASEVKLGVVVPDSAQVTSARADWATGTGALKIVTASPYGDEGTLREVAASLAQWRPELIVLDCLGFDRSMQRLVQESVTASVILPRIALAGAIAALLP